MRFLKPLALKDEYWLTIEHEINKIFYEMFYQPIIRLLQKNHISMEIVTNARDSLLDAMKSGKIFYQDGSFYGLFNSQISKQIKGLGGKFNKLRSTWDLDIKSLPPSVSMAIAQANGRYDKLTEEIIQTLDDLDVSAMVEAADTPRLYEKTIKKINTDFVKAVDAVAIPPKLTQAVTDMLALQWGENLKLYIRGWADQNVLTLRQKVAANAYRGQRAANLVKMIQENYGSSQAKAKFLARQETSLLMSKMRQQRYQDIGSRKYRWSTSKDERVRHDHRELQGKVYAWDSPPVVDHRTGRRANPGEDFNCRCVAIPILGD